jgi:pyruvate dehydrogenase E1 component alpha subunit
MAATQDKPAKKAKKPEPSMGKDELLKAYEKMLLIRRFEEKAGQLYGMGLIAGFCHLYIGQEAVVVGMPATRSSPPTATTATCWPARWTRRA